MAKREKAVKKVVEVVVPNRNAFNPGFEETFESAKARKIQDDKRWARAMKRAEKDNAHMAAAEEARLSKINSRRKKK